MAYNTIKLLTRAPMVFLSKKKTI